MVNVDNGTTGLAAADAGDTPSRVAPLSELLDEFEVADGYPEVRGWEVRDAAGHSIGYVCDLLVDLEAMRVRYLDVELDPEFARDADRRVLIPLESVGLDGSYEEVSLRGIEAADVHTLVPYARRGVTREVAPALDVAIDVEREVGVRPAAGLADVVSPAPGVDAGLPREPQRDVERALDRRFATDREAPLTLGQEALVAGTRPIQAGGVEVWKTVETERVTRSVPLERDDVEIERRPVLPGEVITSLETRGDEIRIPIMAEEVVVEKRLVAKEVLIIRTRRVTEERTVETDVRREQVHVEDPLGRARAGAQDPVERSRALGERGGPEAGA